MVHITVAQEDRVLSLHIDGSSVDQISHETGIIWSDVAQIVGDYEDERCQVREWMRLRTLQVDPYGYEDSGR